MTFENCWDPAAARRLALNQQTTHESIGMALIYIGDAIREHTYAMYDVKAVDTREDDLEEIHQAFEKKTEQMFDD